MLVINDVDNNKTSNDTNNTPNDTNITPDDKNKTPDDNVIPDDYLIMMLLV